VTHGIHFNVLMHSWSVDSVDVSVYKGHLISIILSTKYERTWFE